MNLFLRMLVYLAAIALAYGTSIGQPADTLWTRVMGGELADEGYCVQLTEDGGYIIVGYTASYGAGENDVWLVRTDSLGNEEWSRTFGGSLDDQGNTVQQTTDGGYILIGTTASFSPDSTDDIWLIKTDEVGDTLWTRRWVGGYGNDVRQTPDGGYIIAGTGIDLYSAKLIRIDSVGIEQWNRIYPDVSGSAVTLTSDGGYVYVGSHLNKLDSNGDSLWSRELPPVGTSMGFGNNVEQTLDGGYIVTLHGGGSLPWWFGGAMAKADTQGNFLWTAGLGSAHGVVHQTPDGGYLVGGCTMHFHGGGDDAVLWRVSPNGTILWENHWSSTGTDHPYSMQLASGGGCVMVGSIGHGFWGPPRSLWLLKIGQEGSAMCVSPEWLDFVAVVGGQNPPGQYLRIENTPIGSFEYVVTEEIPWCTVSPMSGGPVQPIDSVYVTVDIAGLPIGHANGYVIITAPEVYGSPDTTHVWLDIQSLDADPDHGGEVPQEFALHQNYPNPFNASTTIRYDLPRSGRVTLKVFDLLGRELAVLKDGFVEAGTHQQSFDANGLASGVYFLRLDAGEFAQTKKLMLLK